MSYKSENWKDKLEEVRAFTKKGDTPVEVKEETSQVDEEIELLLQEIDEKPEVSEENTEPCPTCNGEGHLIVEQEEKLSVEKTVEKLTEKNMLGRLAKSLRLNEEGKQKMFDYFEKGDLEQ